MGKQEVDMPGGGFLMGKLKVDRSGSGASITKPEVQPVTDAGFHPERFRSEGRQGYLSTPYPLLLPPLLLSTGAAGTPPYELPIQYATLSRASGRPSSLHLSRSKSISNSNPDLATSPATPDQEVQRIIGSKVSRGHLPSVETGCCQGDTVYF